MEDKPDNISTPQGLGDDILSNKIDISDVSLLGFG